jgi:hypothetical protein
MNDSPLTTFQRVEVDRITEGNGYGLPQWEVDSTATFTGLASTYRLRTRWSESIDRRFCGGFKLEVHHVWRA